jgi:ATP-dependent Clp protease adapter protein ClpS
LQPMIARPGLSPEAYRRITAFALAALAVIIVSGAAVRLTGSGLGCTDWPNCSQGELVADWEFHPLVEFANRVFTGVVSLAVIAAVAGSLRRVPRRTDLVWWSLGLVAGVIAQIVLGGLVVLFHLSPRLVIGHFLLSMVLVWNAVVLHHRAGEDPAHPAPVRAIGGRYLRWAVNGWFLLAMAVVVTGTVVTGAGARGVSQRRAGTRLDGDRLRRVEFGHRLVAADRQRVRGRPAGHRPGARDHRRPGHRRLCAVLHQSARGAGGRACGRGHGVVDRCRAEPPRHSGGARMTRLSLPSPTEVRDPEVGSVPEADVPWIVLVWNDPINLMSYVTFVLQKVFGYSKEKATALMLDVHHKGRAVVSTGAREKAEMDVLRLHEHGLWATMQQDR